jgi:hypothetical protein
MHLSPAAIEGAIRLLDAGRTGLDSRWRENEVGNLLATGSTEIANSSQ